MGHDRFWCFAPKWPDYFWMNVSIFNKKKILTQCVFTWSLSFASGRVNHLEPVAKGSKGKWTNPFLYDGLPLPFYISCACLLLLWPLSGLHRPLFSLFGQPRKPLSPPLPVSLEGGESWEQLERQPAPKYWFFIISPYTVT